MSSKEAKSDEKKQQNCGNKTKHEIYDTQKKNLMRTIHHTEDMLVLLLVYLLNRNKIHIEQFILVCHRAILFRYNVTDTVAARYISFYIIFLEYVFLHLLFLYFIRFLFKT